MAPTRIVVQLLGNRAKQMQTVALVVAAKENLKIESALFKMRVTWRLEACLYSKNDALWLNYSFHTLSDSEFAH